jgi:cell division protein FtsB
MIIRKLKRKFSISAPRLSVRPFVPWYVRWAIIVPFIFAAGGLVWWAYDSGLELAGFHRGQAEKELEGLHARVAFLTNENAGLANQVASFERQMQIDQSAMQETSKQIKGLNAENEQLKEDLSFFQNLPLTAGREGDLSIHSLKVEPNSLPGEYHCRLLLVQDVQQRGREFQGKLELLVSGDQSGKKVVLQFPQENTPEVAASQLNFKYYQRVDRVFKIQADFRIESVQVRVFEKGSHEPKVQQSIGLS